MLVHKSLHRLWPEQSTIANLIRRQQIAHHLFEVVRQPIVYRSRKSRLGLLQNLGWKNVSHGPPKNVLCRRTERALELHSGWDVPRHEFDQLAIQEWHTNFDG